MNYQVRYAPGFFCWLMPPGIPYESAELMTFDAYLFDLDGTLLDTLPDLTALTNEVLEEWGMPAHTAEEISSYVGGGPRVLVKRAVPPDTPDDVVDALMARWKELYPERGHEFTKPYAGVPETLDALKARGARLGVLSNKFDAATQLVIAEHFPGVFDIVRGEGPDIPRKPDPTGLTWMMAQLGIDAGRAVYVGDTGPDMTVARSAGAVPVGVSWGYRSVEVLREYGAQIIINAAEELLDL